SDVCSPDLAAVEADDATQLPALVAFDRDDTLAPSKTAMPEPMAVALRLLLDQAQVCIISGGQIKQFRDQVLAHLGATSEEVGALDLQ
ncbi:HAD superfamily hydrolase, partial [human gut metagenome]